MNSQVFANTVDQQNLMLIDIQRSIIQNYCSILDNADLEPAEKISLIGKINDSMQQLEILYQATREWCCSAGNPSQYTPDWKIFHKEVEKDMLLMSMKNLDQQQQYYE